MTSTFQLTGSSSRDGYAFINRAKMVRLYTYFKGNLTRLTVENAVPEEREDKSWYYYMHGYIQHPNHTRASDPKYKIVGHIKVSPSINDYAVLPPILSPISQICMVTGDPNMIDGINDGPTFLMKKQEPAWLSYATGDAPRSEKQAKPTALMRYVGKMSENAKSLASRASIKANIAKNISERIDELTMYSKTLQHDDDYL
jgi:hypothetical protein